MTVSRSETLGAWAPIVYGRTASADLWWRAMPQGLTFDAPEAAALQAAAGGGADLRTAERFVLSRHGPRTLLGVACRADRLSADLNTDGQRPLYCFVGWFCAASDPTMIPSLARVEAQWVTWAGREYERWMRPAWWAHPSTLRKPSPTDAQVPPWGDDDGSVGRDRPISAVTPTTVAGQVRVYPTSTRVEIWRAVAAHDDAVLVTGWRRYGDGVAPGVTDLCADDAEAPSTSVAETDDVPGRGAPLRAQPTARPDPVYPEPSPQEPIRAAEQTGAEPVGCWVPWLSRLAQIWIKWARRNVRKPSEPPEARSGSVPPHIAPSRPATSGARPPAPLPSTTPRSPLRPPAPPAAPPSPGPPAAAPSRGASPAPASSPAARLPAPPPPQVDPTGQVFTSDVGDRPTRWDSHQLWTWNETEWVEQGSPTPITDPGVQSSSDARPDRGPAEPSVPAPEASPPAPVSWAPRETASATDIEKRLGSAFDEFEKAPLPEPAPPSSGADQAPCSEEPPPE